MVLPPAPDSERVRNTSSAARAMPFPVEAAVRVEPPVLDRDEGLGDVGRKAGEPNRGAALQSDLAHKGRVARVDLAGLLRLVGVDLGNGGAVRAEVPPGAHGESGAAREQE